MSEAQGLNEALCQNAAPSTFEERGTIVPFTTDGLLYSRVRKARNNHLEVLVSGFSGARCVYVLQWPAVPELFRLTLHDKALHAEISFSEATTPDRIRMAAYRVAKSGLGGADLIEMATRTIERDANEQLSTKCYLMLRLIELTRVSIGAHDLNLEDVNSPEGRKMVREAFKRLGVVLKATPESCYDRILELSETLQPVGFDHDGQRGRMRRRIERLTAFRDAVARSDIGEAGRVLVEVSQLTLRIGNGLLRSTDLSIGDIPGFLVGWDGRMKALKADIERLSWLLDGWNHVCDLWDDAVSGERIKQHRVTEIMRIVPLVPKSELNATQAPTLAELTHRRSRLVQPNQDWRTGQLDQEMVTRMERKKVSA